MTFPDINPYVPLLGPYSFHLGSWHVGPIGVRWYALAYIAGIVLGWRYALSLVKTPRLWGGREPTLTPTQVDDLVLWITLGVVIGGRLGSMLFYNTSVLFSHPAEIFQIWNGGMSFHGGLIGVAVALIGFAWANRKGPFSVPRLFWDSIRLGDLIAPAVPIGLFFGRVANFINGELWGRPSHVPWAMVFCNERLAAEGHGLCPAGYQPRHPSQLYEALLEGVTLFAILWFAAFKRGWLPRRGALSGLFLACYALFRISLENVREPDVGMPHFPLGLTMGMMLSVPMLLAGLWLIWQGLRREPEPQAV